MKRTDNTITQEKLDEVYGELYAVQEMLAIVLNETGDVTVSKEKLSQGLPPGTQIKIDDEAEQFVFGLVVEEQE